MWVCQIIDELNIPRLDAEARKQLSDNYTISPRQTRLITGWEPGSCNQ